jgi:hypothetical protein
VPPHPGGRGTAGRKAGGMRPIPPEGEEGQKVKIAIAIFPTHPRRPFLRRTHRQHKSLPAIRVKKARPRLGAKSIRRYHTRQSPAGDHPNPARRPAGWSQVRGANPHAPLAWHFPHRHFPSSASAARVSLKRQSLKSYTPDFSAPQSPQGKGTSKARHKKPRHPAHAGLPPHLPAGQSTVGNKAHYARPASRNHQAQRTKAAALRVALTPPPPPSPPNPPIPRHPPVKVSGPSRGGRGALMGGAVWVNPKPSVPPQLCVLRPPRFSSYIKISVLRPTAGVSVTSSPIPRSRKGNCLKPPDRLRRPSGTPRHDADTPPGPAAVMPRLFTPVRPAPPAERRAIFAEAFLPTPPGARPQAHRCAPGLAPGHGNTAPFGGGLMPL